MSDYKPTEKEVEAVKEAMATACKTIIVVFPEVISKFAEMLPDIAQATTNFMEQFFVKLNNGEFDDLIAEKLTDMILNAEDKPTAEELKK